jgi:hypothetical protein
MGGRVLWSFLEALIKIRAFLRPFSRLQERVAYEMLHDDRNDSISPIFVYKWQYIKQFPTSDVAKTFFKYSERAELDG